MKRYTAGLLSLILLVSITLSDAQTAYGAGAETTAPAMYSKVLSAIKNGETKVDLSPLIMKGQKFSWNIIYDIEKNDPSIFYLDYSKIKFWSNGVLELGYKYSKSTILSMQKKMNENANAIITKVITKGMSDYQKVMALHDYMADYITYDRQNYYRNTVPDLSHKAYGALVKKVAVCDGYSQAMNLMLRKVGIESRMVIGNALSESGESVGHAWNMVKVNGYYYYLDLTWNDLDEKGKADNSYKYFLVTEKELSVDHSWNKTGLPQATNTRYKELHNASYELYKTKQGIYYSNDLDKDRLYFIKLDGTGKKRLTMDRAISPVVFGSWIYFSNYSNGGYLYKITTNGEEQTIVVRKHTLPLRIQSGRLILRDDTTNIEFTL